MSKEIKEYLHLYLGCECVSTEKKPGTKKYILSAITTDGLYEFKTIPEKFSTVLHNWKPILRPLSDMTEEEAKEFINWNKLNEMYVDVSFVREKTGIVINYGVDVMDYVERLSHKVKFTEWSPNEFLWMLRKGFDLFGLIESGLAIDKTKVS